MKIFNTNTQHEKLTVPTVELINFEEVSIHEEKQTHLNEEEKHVENLIKKYADRFHIPGEPVRSYNCFTT